MRQTPSCPHDAVDAMPPDRTTSRSAVPFLRWAGGKRWAVDMLSALVPERFNRYYEPFLGGGAFYFHITPYPATLSDTNEELINVYRQVRDNVDELIDRLKKHRISHQVFTAIRNKQPSLPVTRAVRFLYLNRTAFNGIHRVNRQGRFNVPFGCKPGTILCDEKVLRHASASLQNRTLHVSDFESAIEAAGEGDVVYADPPYTVKHNNNGFRRYNEVLFAWADQERLARACRRAVKRGVHVIVSNAYHEPIIDLYHGFGIAKVYRESRISAGLQGRGRVAECVLRSISTE